MRAIEDYGIAPQTSTKPPVPAPTTVPIKTPAGPQDGPQPVSGKSNGGEAGAESKSDSRQRWKQNTKAAEFYKESRDLMLKAYAGRGKELSDVQMTTDEFLSKLFPADYIWIGEKHMTGEKWAHHFGYSYDLKCRDHFICPNPFREGTADRRAENVECLKYLVLESDTLSEDETLSMFEFVIDEFKLQLVAIVHSGNKSLHGWFRHPGEGWLDTYKPTLEALGFDPACTRSAQPVRLPGVIRKDTGKSQALRWFKDPEDYEGSAPCVKGGEDVVELQKAKKLHWDDIVSRTYWMKGKYYFKYQSGQWREFQEKDYRTALGGTKFFNHLTDSNQSREKALRAEYFEQLKQHVFENNSVVFVGELAGHKEGVTVWKGQKYLITRGPVLIEPKEGEFPTIQGLLLQAFGEEQLPYILGWLKTGYESLVNGEMNTGQALVIAGEPGVGKSCIKELIIRPVLGGRNCDPAAFLQGDTRFNSDLSGNEVWEMDDQIGVSDAHRRKTYETAFKKLAANANHRTEGKGTNAVQPPPLFHRLIVCTNDNESDLFVLPPQTDSTADKMIVLKASRSDKPLVNLPTNSERKAFREKIESELPAFIHWLLNWEIPAEIQDSRYGVKAYRNPELAAKLDSMTDEARVLQEIDTLLFRQEFSSTNR